MADLSPLAGAAVIETAKRVAPFLIILSAAILMTLYVQIGTLFTLQPLKPELGKLNPLNGFKRLFSTRMLMMA